MYRAARATLIVCSHQHGVRVGVAYREVARGVQPWCSMVRMVPMPHAMDPWWSWISITLYGGVVLRPPWAKDLAPCSDYARDLPGTTHRLKSQTNPAPAATVQTRVTVTCREV
jgi:hypothetical protein